MPEWLWWVLGGLGILVGVWLVVSLLISVFAAGKVFRFQKQIFNEFDKDDFFKAPKDW